LNALQSSLTVVASALPSGVLLWLAATLHAQALNDTALSQRGLRGIALGLAAAGIWWPLHLAGMIRGGVGDLAFQAALVSMALALPAAAAHAATGAETWRDGGRLRAAAAALLLSALGIAAVSGVDGTPMALTRTTLGAATVAGMLFVLARPAADARRAMHLHVGAAVAAAGALVFAPLPFQHASNAWPQPALWPTLALALFGAGLVRMLRHRLPDSRISPRLPAQPAEPLEDALTRLPTRSHFEAQLAAAVVQCDASRGKLALLFIDLDGFKPVNDTFGHSSGDRVLHNVGKRLKGCAGSGDVIARVGGDEFLMLIGNAGSQEDVARRARKIVAAIAQPFEVEDRQVGIGCSIGIAFYPESGGHSKLIARADAAMYAAKRAGGAGFCFFMPAMEDDARDRFDLLRDLRLALDHNQLELFYQPKIDAASGKITAAEALLRWQHPTRGMVPPSVFIPVAERFGLIHSIGQWVINDACRQARVWLDKGLKMRVAINLSAVQMRQDDIVARIEGALAQHRVDPSLLTCEITESVAMEDTKATQATFRALGSAGIHLAIDDFGTGYSSLSYLRKLPAEELKIDRSFVMDVENSADARAVIDAVVKLAHALSLKVVAEGVENERQQRILIQLGCDELQGFLFAKPMTARALLLWAIDDRRQQAQSFATSLFATTRSHLRGFETTRGEPTATTAADRSPPLPLAEQGEPQVH
jgi:diguanylate cyclase (GGDEF)-like protein